MLESLHIRNYILIDSLDVDFPDGLVIITGQTGAGKSIILGALSLLMGGKADASVISGGADSCVVEAEFRVSGAGIEAELEENDVEWNGGRLTVRRVVHSSGRSRSFINDTPVNVGLLTAISSRLVDIHSQHQSLMLTDHRFQLAALDGFAGNGVALGECRAEWTRLNSLRGELQTIRSEMARMEAEREYDEARYARLEAASPRDGELAELDEEQKTLANAEEIKQALHSARMQMDPEDDDLQPVSAALKEAQRCLTRITPFLPAAAAVADRIESARIDLDDILSELETMDAGVEVSPTRLDEVEKRQALIMDLLRKFGCSSEEELIALKESLAGKLSDSSSLEDRAIELEGKIREAETSYGKAAAALHEARKAAASRFADAIQDKLRFLELDRAVFKVALEVCPAGPAGTDAVSFLFDASGMAPRDVSKCASGGEISRIMLCLKAMMAANEEMPTMVFDEIDTGVSGSVADKMGSLICEMGADMQVFAITHLPQVAAKGNAHFLVSKSVGDRTQSTIKKLSREERVMEIARMLSGSSISDEAVANARILLD